MYYRGAQAAIVVYDITNQVLDCGVDNVLLNMASSEDLSD